MGKFCEAYGDQQLILAIVAMADLLTRKILKLVNSADGPLATVEITDRITNMPQIEGRTIMERMIAYLRVSTNQQT